jgi:hypothetical protein
MPRSDFGDGGVDVFAEFSWASWLPWAELLRRTVGVDPEICVCGARMIVNDAITDGEKIAETLARIGVQSTGLPKRRQSTGELDYLYEL